MKPFLPIVKIKDGKTVVSEWNRILQTQNKNLLNELISILPLSNYTYDKHVVAGGKLKERREMVNAAIKDCKDSHFGKAICSQRVILDEIDYLSNVFILMCETNQCVNSTNTLINKLQQKLSNLK